MDSGERIRKLLEERGIRPRDVERLSRLIAENRGNERFLVSHSTLNEIKGGSDPSVHKLFTLATCLGMPLEQLLFFAYGIDANQSPSLQISSEQGKNEVAGIDFSVQHHFAFTLPFDNQVDRRTSHLLTDWSLLESFPKNALSGVDPVRFRLAVVGIEDDTMGDIIPAGSVVQVDTEQSNIQESNWKTMRERPIFLVWHQEGYTCSWIQQEGNELILVPHPASRQKIRRFKTPRDASIIGRVVNAWSPFQSVLSPAG